jgi:two-component system response regulator HydG
MTTKGDPGRGRRDDTAPATLAQFHSEDPAMMVCLKTAQAAAASDLPVLILGESGTGKTLLARALHASSGRRSQPFIAFNAAALSDTLIDSQLFGHEAGAFTSAERRVRGKFELADGGTLFIDEIADMTPAAQARILRAVESGEFERLGSETLQTADVRLISATHLPLKMFVSSDRFRRDLFYRISGITLMLPPLRERPRDLRILIATEMAVAGRRQRKRITGLAQDAADRLFAHPWPGNLRELSRVIQVAVALTDGAIVESEAILLDAVAGAPAGDREEAAEGQSNGIETLAEAERRHVRSVLERVGGNKARAARALAVSRSTLDRKLKP